MLAGIDNFANFGGKFAALLRRLIQFVKFNVVLLGVTSHRHL